MTVTWACANCGHLRGGELRWVAVIAVENPAGGAARIPLCERCLSVEGAAWRRRWKPVNRQAAAR